MSLIFGIWGSLCSIILIFSTVKLIAVDGKVFSLLVAAMAAWFLLAVVPCLAYILINQILKLA